MEDRIISIVRTPDERFVKLPGFDFDPNYLDSLDSYKGMRAHYLDEGPSQSKEIFLCLHGQPTWSYLYRKMIPIFSQNKVRSIAPDLFGFGRSDKPVNDEVYTFNFHRQFLLEFIKKLDLKNITLVCQDWGGLLGLTLPMEMPERFSRLLVMNTGLGTGYGLTENKAFMKWKEFNESHRDLNVGDLILKSTSCMTYEESLSYSAPFPNIDYKGGVRSFTKLVPDCPDSLSAKISQTAFKWWKNEWKGKSFMAIGMQDPILGPKYMYPLSQQIAGCPTPFEISDAGHFVQEWGDLVATKALESFELV